MLKVAVHGCARSTLSGEATVDFLADQAAGGPALEFAVGTGRIALPPARRGVPVHGIDMSRAMTDRLRAKPGGDHIPVTIGDVATRASRTPPDTSPPAAGSSSRSSSPNSGACPPGRTSSLDLMARIAGLRPVERWEGWGRAPFTGESGGHVSVWEKPVG